MKTVLASEAMELCAKAMEPGFNVKARAEDVRAIYQAAATIYATALGDARLIPIPDWLAKVDGS